MAFVLITGQPRNGKSQRVMPIFYDIQKENDKRESEGYERAKIYTDIEGINAPTTPNHFKDAVTNLTLEEKETIWFGNHDDPRKPEGHWCPPLGSHFFFDECHKLEWVRDCSGSVSKNWTTISLNEGGHSGHNVYFITQFPQYIHTHIRGLLNFHMHVKRKFGANYARVYHFDEFKLNPRTESAMNDAYEVETFKFKKKWQDSYKSASAHEKFKFNFPKKLILPIAAVLFIFLYIAYSVFTSDEGSLTSSIFKKVTGSTSDVVEMPENIKNLQEQNQQQLEELNNIRFELEELKAMYLPKHIAVLAEHEEVRPAMIVSSSTTCTAYNRYGEPLAITDSLCYQMDNKPALIPRSRQDYKAATDTQESQPDTLLPDTFTPEPLPQSVPQNNVKTFESPRPYT